MIKMKKTASIVLINIGVDIFVEIQFIYTCNFSDRDRIREVVEFLLLLLHADLLHLDRTWGMKK